MTDPEKISAIYSIWSNENKLTMAKYIRDNSPCSPIQIINATSQISALVSRNIKDMVKAGVLEKSDYKEQDSRQVFYRLTPIGKKILNILD